MQDKQPTEPWKIIGSAIIIGAAACIMLPGLLGYLAGLWRLAVLIGIIIATACIVGQIVGRAMLARQRKLVTHEDAGEESP